VGGGCKSAAQGGRLVCLCYLVGPGSTPVANRSDRNSKTIRILASGFSNSACFHTVRRAAVAKFPRSLRPVSSSNCFVTRTAECNYSSERNIDLFSFRFKTGSDLSQVFISSFFSSCALLTVIHFTFKLQAINSCYALTLTVTE
jgi:hypothetical protein